MKPCSILIEVDAEAVRRSFRSGQPGADPVAYLGSAICRADHKVKVVTANEETHLLEIAGPVQQLIEIQKWIFACKYGSVIAHNNW